MTLSPAELAAMPRTTPTAIAEAAYARGRDRRHSTPDDIPHANAAWRPTKDPDVLRRFMRRVLADELAEAVTADERRAVARGIIDDIDARFPPADMAVLARYGLTQTISTVTVEIVTGIERLTLPGTRELPMTSVTRLQPQIMTSVPARADERVALLPEPLRAMFDAIDAIRDLHSADLRTVEVWPVRFHQDHKRRPTWREIETAFPRLGAWMAKQREK